MSMRRLGTALAVAVLVTGAACGSSGSKDGGPTVAVPRGVQNAYPADAIAALCSAGLDPLIVAAPPITGADRGVNGYAVKAVIPPVGTAVPKGSAVQLQLAESSNAAGFRMPGGKRPVLTPTVVGLDVNQAIGILTRDGLRVDVTTQALVTSLDVARQSPQGGASTRTGSTVSLVVGSQNGTGCRS